MAIKKSQTPKKTTPVKKSEIGYAEKNGITKKTSPVKKSSVVKKEIKPITPEETKAASSINKTERESVRLLKEAIKAKTDTSKSKSKPVTVTKHSAVFEGNKEVTKKEEPKQKEVNLTKREQTVKKEPYIEKATYTKADLLKNKRENEAKNEKVSEKPIMEEAKKEEIKDKEESKVFIFDNMNKNASEITKEDKEDIVKKEESKPTSFPEIEKKPATPYVAPHYPVEKTKKSNRLIAVLGVLVIIAGLSFMGYQFLSSRNNREVIDDIYALGNNETNEYNDLYETNENLVNTNLQETNMLAMNDNAMSNEAGQNVEVKSEGTINEAKTNVALTENTTETIKTPPTPPTPPETPVFNPPTPPTPPPASANINENMDTRTYKVAWKDTLASIAYKELGDSKRWPTIFALNESLIKTPDNFTFGINIILPQNKKTVEAMTAEEKEALYNDYMKVSDAYAKSGKKALSDSIKNQAASIRK